MRRQILECTNSQYYKGRLQRKRNPDIHLSMEQEHPFTVRGAINEGWRLTKEHLGFLIGFQLIMLSIVILLSSAAHYYSLIVLNLLSQAIGALLNMGFYKSALSILDGIKPTFDQLYKNWPHFISWMVAGFLFGLMFLLGFLLLIVPGLYVLSRFGLYPFFILDKGLGPIEALKQTSEASKDHLWPLFLLFMAYFGLNILGFLLLGIGLLFTAPLSLLALGVAYRAIQRKMMKG